MLGDEAGDVIIGWGPLTVAALAYVAVGAWDWTDTVEALARYVSMSPNRNEHRDTTDDRRWQQMMTYFELS